MPKTIDKAYEPGAVEEKWYPWWEAQGFFRGNPASESPKYSIVLPPPNVTGSLHMGHALNMTLQDILSRWKRMQGFDVLWLPGTDHAGIATQNVVERQLAQKGQTRMDLGREEFEKVVWRWKETAQDSILKQARRLGCSCDWSRERFTLDEGLSKAVREVFVRLYEEGLIYRGEYLVNWCPRCTTAISDLEVEYQPVEGSLWHIRYPLRDGSGEVVVATTRPETMLGDTAVAVHPEDERYGRLHGRTVTLPLMEREIPVIQDAFVDREFGTGVVKVTPGHDPNDFEAGRRHGLPVVKVIGEKGQMTGEAGPYSGLDRFEARKRVVEDLEGRGLLLKVEKHSHNVGHCQRCHTVIEPLVSTQWFVRAKPLADETVKAVEAGRTVFVPPNYERVYFEWMANIHDWCISRQLWWGHRIPAWYCGKCGEVTVARDRPEHCSHCQHPSLEQESDVLDTWFSSALWPFSTLGWPEKTGEIEAYYPTSTLVTGFDIIFFWVARMMMMGLRFMGDVPFKVVHINGLVRDEHGQKMSKSRGNVIDPLEIMDQYGTDAMRFTLAVMAVPGTDIPFSISRMSGYRAFCNKIWNAGRFLLMNLQGEDEVTPQELERFREQGRLTLDERWILSRLEGAIRETNENLEKFRFHEASNNLYHFVWHEFCDWFIEFAKSRMTGADPGAGEKTARVAVYVFERSLRLLHPFVPFITEHLWHELPHSGASLMTARFPSSHGDWLDQDAEQEMGRLQDFITSIRTLRAENNIDPRKKIGVEVVCKPEYLDLLQSESGQIRQLAQSDPLHFVSELGSGGIRMRGVSRAGDFALLLDGVLDLEGERARLEQQIDVLFKQVKRLESQLQNPQFVEKAPREVVDTARERRRDALEHLQKLREKLDGLP